MIKIISSNITTINKFFENHKVEQAYVFSTAVRGNYNENSDIDFLIKFKAGIGPLEKGEL